MSRDFLNPDAPIEKHRDGDLPHWSQDEVMQFVTFRLGDALPSEKVMHWKVQSETFRNTWPPPWSLEVAAEYHREFTMKLERWLDQGSGACWFRDDSFRNILEEIIMRFQGERVKHHAWVIMPNHVHLLFKPIAPIGKLIQAWKSVSAKRIGKGTIWQPSYRDTLIRDGGHFANAVRYIRNNPVKAKLRNGEFTLWQSERAMLVK
ncbi:MAG: transposase [Luteolibacter sp.]|uniref:transposase n=1 Tax=Luteolibacter sp. TaxID=1962973 RepID=UPI003263616A